MEKERIALVVMKLEANANGLSTRSGVKRVTDELLGDKRGKEFEDYFRELFVAYKVEEMLDKLAFKFAELCGDQIDVVVDTEELERQIKEAREHEI